MPALRIQTNMPEQVRLLTVDGENAPSSFGADQLRYRTDKGDLYVSPAVGKIFAAAIAAQGIQAGEPVIIAKLEASLGNGRKSIRWSMDRAGTSHGAKRERSDAHPTGAYKPLEDANHPHRPIGEQPDGTFAIPMPPAPAVVARPAPAARPQWADILLAQTNLLADGYAAAVAHSSPTHGHALRPGNGRANMTTAFFNLSEGINPAT